MTMKWYTIRLLVEFNGEVQAESEEEARNMYTAVWRDERATLYDIEVSEG